MTDLDCALTKIARQHMGIDTLETRRPDSRQGRHFADEVAMHMTDDASQNSVAIDMAVDRWMRWTISPRTSEDTGIPVNLPYLTGFVLHAAIAADAI